MTVFYENDPSLQSYWRSIVLYGKNVASYKFALAKSLIDLKGQPNDLIKLEDLASSFSKHLCEHLKHNDKQSTNPSNSFLNTCRKFNSNETSLDELIQATKKLGFIYVIAFMSILFLAIWQTFESENNKSSMQLVDERLSLIEEQINIVDETNPSVIRALNRRVDIVISYPEKKEEIIEEEEKKENKIILENVLFITGYSYLTRLSKRP